MCGINLIIDKRRKLDDTHIQLMNQATQYRGPDGSFHESLQIMQSKVFLGHNRLKILDLSNQANQPFYSHDNQHILLFNGEIYNYQTLKNQLKHKYHFKTRSDTEVLLYWLIEKGIEGIGQLEGMFAFVWVDIQRGMIFFARDSFYIKPLYYYNDDQYFIVSSEIKGILSTNLVDQSLNEDQIVHYLTYKFAQAPQTFFQGIMQVSSLMSFEISTNRLEKVKIENTKSAPQDLPSVADLESLLIQSVEQQLQADVPVGIFLSGGIDSTLLASIIQELGIKNTPSFSLVNSVKEENFGTRDHYYARLAAQQFGSEYQEIQVKPTDFQSFDIWVQSLNQPIADGAFFLTDLLSQFARKSVKVALSGAGADELFAGYNRHSAFYRYLNNYRVFKSLSSRKALFSSIALDGFAHPWRKKSRLIKKFVQSIDSSPAQTFINFTKLSGIPLNYPSLESQPLPIIPLDASSDWFRWCLKYDQQQFLAQDVLALTDVMSMRHSLEVRVPYLSQKLYHSLQYFNPVDLLQQGRKGLLKQWLLKRGGEVFVKRSKEGFGMPFGYWLQQGTLPWVENHLKMPQLFVYKWVNYKGFQQMLNLHMKQKHDYTSEIWAVFLLSQWLEAKFPSYSS
ncbi:asparagine synthase (glutamine-hydrolyzing) [marine bacterium AO1-C]|nr:asparagine synthase (glutamine-hydrolyzing) [marine bacterium AO1-C]